MKANRLNSKVTAGPQSNILEGYTWEEIKQMQEQINRSGDNVVLVGAASKGIIQRDFQHNAMVYKSAYQKNPFDGITEEVSCPHSENGVQGRSHANLIFEPNFTRRDLKSA